MTQPAKRPEPQDNRRAIVRIMSREILEGLAALARLNGGDMIQLLVFTGIWSSNTRHLVASGRYAALHDIPPDSQRLPVPQPVLAAQLGIPGDIVARYVDQLVEAGMAERLPGGLVVPTAVFRRPDMMDGSNEFYSRVVQMVVALRGAAFQFGEDV